MRPSSNIRDIQNIDNNQEAFPFCKTEAAFPFPNGLVLHSAGQEKPKQDQTPANIPIPIPIPFPIPIAPIVQTKIEEEKKEPKPDPNDNEVPSLDSSAMNSGRKKAYSPEENELLADLVKKYGDKNWSKIAEFMPGRNRKQLRDHYINFIKSKPVLKDFTEEEDAKILGMVAKYGHKWQKIADNLPGRSPLMIKNRYNMKLKKKPKGKRSLFYIKHRNNTEEPQNKEKKLS